MTTTAPSESPLFDSLANRLRPAAGRPTTPFATAATSRPARRQVQASLPSVSSLVSDPIPAQELTADERDLIASMGGTVARLLLEMMHEGRPRR